MIFCDRVLECLSRATKKEKEAVRAELEAHIEDHRDALIERGMDPMAALNKAEEDMGDPEKVGQALNAQFSTFWLWAKRGIQAVICLALLLLLFSETSLLTDPWKTLTGAWENWQARQGKAVEFGTEYQPENVIRTLELWETMQVGEEIICLCRVELTPWDERPDYYIGHFYFCTYSENLFDPPNNNVLGQLTVTPESGPIDLIWGLTGWRQGWYRTAEGNGAATMIYKDVIKEGDAYVDVTYDHYGTYVTMRCYLNWEEGEP